VERRRHPAGHGEHTRVSGWPDRRAAAAADERDPALERIERSIRTLTHTHTEKKPGTKHLAENHGIKLGEKGNQRPPRQGARPEERRAGGGGGAPYLAERRLPHEELVRVEHSGCAAERRRRRVGVLRGVGLRCVALRAVRPVRSGKRRPLSCGGRKRRVADPRNRTRAEGSIGISTCCRSISPACAARAGSHRDARESKFTLVSVKYAVNN
jgi:hypothetical protein